MRGVASAYPRTHTGVARMERTEREKGIASCICNLKLAWIRPYARSEKGACIKHVAMRMAAILSCCHKRDLIGGPLCTCISLCYMVWRRYEASMIESLNRRRLTHDKRLAGFTNLRCIEINIADVVCVRLAL